MIAVSPRAKTARDAKNCSVIYKDGNEQDQVEAAAIRTDYLFASGWDEVIWERSEDGRVWMLLAVLRKPEIRGSTVEQRAKAVVAAASTGAR